MPPATIPGDPVTLPSLEPVFKAVRRIRALESSLAKAREDRDVEILRAVEGGWKPAHVAQRLQAKFTDLRGVSTQTIFDAVRGTRERRKR